jgi:2-oxoglutarate dehydrogenase E1 component
MSDEPKSSASFGPNVWLIDEMFREFKERPESVSESWREFFSDYRPAAGRIAPPPPLPEAPAAREVPTPPEAAPAAVPLIGPARRLVENMQASLSVPTASSVRTIPVRLLAENRTLMNQHLAELTGGKVSFTHLLAWAIVKALHGMPGMRSLYVEIDGAP